MGAEVWAIDGRVIHVAGAVIDGPIQIGSQVEVQGYFTEDARFVAVSIELEEAEGDSSEDPRDEDAEGTEDDVDGNENGKEADDDEVQTEGDSGSSEPDESED
jgi:hypothetical protein